MKIEIKTKDGSCPTYVYRPTGKGPWPAVLVFMDGLGIRPAMLEIGERLARHGYCVLLPDLYYRSGPYEPMNPHTVFSDPEQRKVLMEKFISLVTPGQRHVRHESVPGPRSSRARRQDRWNRDNRVLHGRTHVADRRWHLS